MSARRALLSTPALVLALAALAVAAWALERHPRLAAVRAALQRHELDVGEHGVTKLHQVLMQDGHLRMRYQRGEDGTVKRVLATVDVPPGEAAPSTAVVDPQMLCDGLNTVSIVTDEVSLHDPVTGIFQHPKKKGREWERYAHLSYFSKGELTYEGPVGLRVQGGNSRGWPVKSLQVIFRRGYGDRFSPPGVFFDGESLPYQRIVFSNTWRERRIGNFVAYEIAEAIGCTVSRTEPVRVLLNGQGVAQTFYTVEHQSRTFLENHFGTGDYLWHRLKAENRNIEEFAALEKWARDKRIRKTMAEVERRFDIENLSAWVLAIAFCDTDDSDQGGYFRNIRSSDPRWRCLTWDLDCSFLERIGKRDYVPFSDKVGGLRAHLFAGLLRDDPAFSEYFLRFATDALNHRIHSAMLDAVVKKYRAIHEAYGESEKNRAWLTHIERLLAERPREMRAALAAGLKSGPFHACTVGGVPGRYSVDGCEKEGAYTGEYPAGRVLTVELDASAPRVAHWNVNGEIVPATGQRIEHTVRGPAVIAPVFAHGS